MVKMHDTLFQFSTQCLSSYVVQYHLAFDGCAKSGQQPAAVCYVIDSGAEILKAV